MREVMRRFGLGEPREEASEAARGAMGRVFRLETSSGVWAVKELFPHRHPDGEVHEDDPAEALERQAAFVEAALQGGVAAPRIVRSVDSEVVASIDGVRWRAFEWIDIVGPAPLRRAGATLARLHAIGWPTEEPVDPFYTRRTFGGPWEGLLKLAKSEPWAPLLREQIPELTALDAIADGATMPPCRMCHRDFNEANVALDTAGRVVVLDWDNCGPLAPEWEVAHVLVDGGRGEWFLDKESGVRAFAAGYREAGGVFAPAGLEVFGTAIASHHNFLAEMILATLGGDAWARDVLESMLTHPFTIDYLRRTLDAAA